MFCSKSHTNLTLEECPCSLEMQSAAASHINVSSSDLKWKSSWWTARFSWQVASIRYESPHTYKISIINWSSTENTRKERTLDRSLHLSGDAKGVTRWVYSWTPTPLISSTTIMGPIMLWLLISFNTNFRTNLSSHVLEVELYKGQNALRVLWTSVFTAQATTTL